MTEQTPIKMVDSILLSEYILETGGSMSHLKLQKILFYIQALHLAYFDQPIIQDDFQAWLHGPVSRKLYDNLKGISIIHKEIRYIPDDNPLPSEILPRLLTEDQLELVDEVISDYSKLSAAQLENLTHSQSPWQEARIGYDPGDRCEVVITQDSMKSFYKKELYGR